MPPFLPQVDLVLKAIPKMKINGSEEGMRSERHFLQDLDQPYIVHFLKAELMRTCVLLLCHCHSCLVRLLKLVNS